MVMDATQNQQPSPQSVGREFVRQYYTLLNKAPNHLHRFYNTNSSFIHGESTLVVGQKNIHNRIQQLNFHDCHAKISQVDAQATLGNGVVVQVTGELSNDGQPMRRFTQTFVLGAQSPKKYYVHNDIFRYQDMYPEEDNDGDSRSENGDENEALSAPVVNEQPPQAVGGLIADQQQTIPNQVVVTSAGVMPVIQQSSAPQQQTIYYSMPPAGGRPMPVLAPPQAAAVPLGAQFATGGATNIPQHQVAATPTVSQLNGVVGHEDLLTTMPQPSAGQQPLAAQAGSPVMQATSVAVAAAPMLASQTTGGVAVLPVPNTGLPQNTTGIITGFPQNPVMQQQMIQQPSLSNNQPNIMHSQGPPILSGHLDGEDSVSPDVNSRTSPATLVPRQPTPAPIVEDFKTINDQQQQAKYEAAKQQQHQQNEPKTYANLFKSTSSSPSGFVNAAMQQQQQLQQQQQQQSGFQPTTISTSTFTQSNTAPSLSSYNNNRNNESSSLRLDNNSGPLPQRNNSRMNKGDFDQRRSSNPQFGDNQQLFLGNIPHHASEEELKTLFGRFGTVLELRILSKPGGNKIQPGVRNPLNYGFITYDDPEAVQNCLSHCPLYFPENTPDAQKLNVEEKKPRVRPNDIPRQSMGNNVNNNVNNAQRNNMSGGGGPPSRPLSNSGGGMMRGPRIGGAFNRNESRSNGGGGSSQVRGNNNSQSGGGSYGSRR